MRFRSLSSQRANTAASPKRPAERGEAAVFATYYRPQNDPLRSFVKTETEKRFQKWRLLESHCFYCRSEGWKERLENALVHGRIKTPTFAPFSIVVRTFFKRKPINEDTSKWYENACGRMYFATLQNGDFWKRNSVTGRRQVYWQYGDIQNLYAWSFPYTSQFAS